MYADGVACCSGVFFELLVHLYSADEHSQQFGCQLLHLNILLGVADKFLYAFVPHIHLADSLCQLLQLTFLFSLLLLVSVCHRVVAFGCDSSRYSVLVQAPNDVVQIVDSLFKLLFLYLGCYSSHYLLPTTRKFFRLKEGTA